MSVIYRGRDQFKVSRDAPLLGIGLPVRATGPIEFYITLFQATPPLNVKTAFIVQKGMLPAAARNQITADALKAGIRYVLFFDDDVLFPDITIYRLWAQMQLHPEAGVINGIYSSKLHPPEPMIYADFGSGAYLDWPLGVLVPIHSAGAGCMMVNMAYVEKLSPPWFQDSVITTKEEDGTPSKASLGHDRFFMDRLKTETGAVIYADTGLLLAHMEVQTGKIFVLPPESPCFQRPILGESFVPSIDEQNAVTWTRIVTSDRDDNFRGYLQWLAEKVEQNSRVDLITVDTPPAAPDAMA